MRIALDTNVLVAGLLNPVGNPGRIVDLFLAGILFSGYVLWFWRGIVPPPQPSAYVLAGKIAVAAPLGFVLWALAIRDAFRRTR